MHWRLFFKVLALSTFISAAVASLFLYPVKEAGHVAAWVQAIGSIGALAGVYWATNRNRESALGVLREEQSLKERAQIGSVLSRIKMANDLANTAYKKINEKQRIDNEFPTLAALNVNAMLAAEGTLQYMELYLRSLREAPLEQIQSEVFLSRVLDFGVHLEAVIKTIEICQKGAGNRPDFQDIAQCMPGVSRSELIDVLNKAMLNNLLNILKKLDEVAVASEEAGRIHMEKPSS